MQNNLHEFISIAGSKGLHLSTELPQTYMQSSHVPVAPQKKQKQKKTKAHMQLWGETTSHSLKPSEKASHDESRSPAIWLNCKDWIVAPFMLPF